MALNRPLANRAEGVDASAHAQHADRITPCGAASLALARLCADLLDSNKLADIALFDVSQTLQITDFFVLASGTNSRQIKTAGDFVDKELRGRGVRRLGIEGHREGRWVLLDYDVVVVHLFLEESRRYYDLELLWGDSPRVEWKGSAPASRSGADGPMPKPSARSEPGL